MYRVEIFDMYERKFVSAFMMNDNTEITEDYISPKPFSIEAPTGQEVELKNTVRIVDGTLVYFSGFVKAIERTETKTIITVAPLILLLDEKSVQNVSATDWGRQINWQIYYDFNRDSPTLYKIPFYRYSDSYWTNWDGVEKPYLAELLNDKDCIILAATTYGKYMSFGVSVGSGWVGVPHYGYKKFNSTKVIEADLENIISQEIVETDSTKYNIGMIWVPRDDESGNYVWYTALLIDGEIIYSGDRKSEITEPRLVETVFSIDKNTDENRKRWFMQNLKPGTDNLSITLTVAKNDPLVKPIPWSYGQPTTVLANGKEYNTYYTGRTIRGDIVEMKFGTVRNTLTEKLLLRSDNL